MEVNSGYAFGLHSLKETVEWQAAEGCWLVFHGIAPDILAGVQRQRPDSVYLVQLFTQPGRISEPGCFVLFQTIRLGQQHSGLEFAQPVVPTKAPAAFFVGFQVIQIPFAGSAHRRALFATQAAAICIRLAPPPNVAVVGKNHSPFAGAGQLRLVKAECPYISKTADLSPPVLSSVGLGAIFHHGQAVLLG